MISLLFHDVYARDPHESGFSSAAADRYKLSVAQFDAQLAGLARARTPAACLMTFDDGGVSFHSLVADRLEALGWWGHCFISTDYIGKRGFMDARQIRNLDARGHVIGSHSASHPSRIDTRHPAEILSEWRRSLDVLQDILGHAVLTASVPGGRISRAVARAAQEAGICTLFTSEPTTAIHFERTCALIGRFVIKCSSHASLARRLAQAAPFARWRQWASWNSKRAIKPILGSTYGHVADWLLPGPASPSFDSQSGERS